MASPYHEKIARVIHLPANEERIIVLIGMQEVELPWHGPRPALGDAFLTDKDLPVQQWPKIGTAAPDSWHAGCEALRLRKHDARGASRYQTLWQRHKVRRAVRAVLDEQGFIEIDAPLLVHGTTPDATIQSFSIEDRYLTTSTEYQIKRLEVAGFERIYTLTQNYRKDDGQGPTRNPEFTMLEWARVGETLQEIEEDARAMTLAAHKALGGRGKIPYRVHSIDLDGPWDRQSVQEALARHAQAELRDFSTDELRRAAQKAGLPLKESWLEDQAFLFSLLMDHIQPHLGTERPLFLCDWPSFETSSAQEKSEGALAQRSELFIAGLEIADGFPSMTDPVRQAETFAQQQKRRKEQNIPTVETDAFYEEALRAGLPSGAGMALGFDRLVMALTESEDIRSVLAFAWEEV